MEQVASIVHTNGICKGCLSRDRLLQIVRSHEVIHTYCTIIDEKVHAHPLLLCWECVANIQRYISFKLQCMQAHKTLLKYMLTPTTITSLSKLAIVKNNNVINIPNENDYCDKLSTKLPNHHESFNCRVNINTGASTKMGEPHIGVTTTEETLQDDIQLTPMHKRETDIHFIKVEEDAVFDDMERDNGFNGQNEIDDKNLNVEFEPGYVEKTEAKSKRGKEKELKSDFNDSDEEPLKNKKRKKTVKERKHKRKKNNGSPKQLKMGGGRREKPAGVVSSPRVGHKLRQLGVGEGCLEMVVLSWDQVEEERQKALSSVVFTRHEYRCHDCIVGFNHKFKLDNHMKKHDPSSGEMECTVCKVRCRDSHALCAHRRRHRVRWRCCLCGETASRAAVAADHVAREHHAPPPTHTCTVCGHAEPTLGKLRNHIKNHAERQKCELCGKTFRDRTSLRTHLFIHNGEKEYSCPRCHKQFLFKKAMEVHLITHDAPAHLYCHQCDMNFKNRMSYTQHMKYSLKHIDPAKLKFACPLCARRFAKAGRLREHHVAVHLKATPVHCSLPGCNFACASRPVLRTHVRMVHRNARAQRNHVCHTCGKAYTTKKTLEGHMRSHTGERPFACAQCGATFGYSAALYNHNKLVHRQPKGCRRLPPPPGTLPAPEPTS